MVLVRFVESRLLLYWCSSVALTPIRIHSDVQDQIRRRHQLPLPSNLHRRDDACQPLCDPARTVACLRSVLARGKFDRLVDNHEGAIRPKGASARSANRYKPELPVVGEEDRKRARFEPERAGIIGELPESDGERAIVRDAGCGFGRNQQFVAVGTAASFVEIDRKGWFV